MTNDYSVLVIGCKKHEEVASKYFDLAKIYWNSSIKKTHFCSDIITDFQREFPCTICEKNSMNFADRIKNALADIKTDFVVLMLDDYFITDFVKDSDLIKLICYLNDNNLEYCKLIGLPKSFKKNKGLKNTFKIKKNKHYGVSLQPSVWNVESLKKALELCNGLTAWEVESSFQKYQIVNYSKCLTFNKNFLHYRNAVLRGKLFPYTNKLLEKNNLSCLEQEKISFKNYFFYRIKCFLSVYSPSFVRRIFKRFGRLFGKTYYSDD